VRPVHPELELLDDPGDHADGEVDQEELAEELRQPEVVLVAGPQPGGLQAGDDGGQPDRQRHEEEVVDGDDPELPASDVEDFHDDPSERSVTTTCSRYYAVS